MHYQRIDDDTILKALAIDTPELKIPNLPPIGEDENVVNLPFRRPSKITTPAWIGIAASFALAAIIGVQFVGSGPSNDRLLAETVLAHVDHEPWALKVTDVSVSDGTQHERDSRTDGHQTGRSTDKIAPGAHQVKG